MLNKLCLPLLGALLMLGCSSSSNTLNVTPKIVLPQQVPNLQSVTISINGADQRQDQALATVNRNGQLVTLRPTCDLRFLLQELLEKQMNARGYMIGNAGVVNLKIVVNNLYADVSEGNLRYNITTKANISVIAQAKNGNKQVKNYRSTYNVQGAFTATNEKITSAVNSMLGVVIANMAQDTIINDFIQKNAY
ncbi:MAG: hypothetical protein G5663_01140 [Serratia symbiotica]|nr:hypothetical protein [Serratia symbiotica]